MVNIDVAFGIYYALAAISIPLNFIVIGYLCYYWHGKEPKLFSTLLFHLHASIAFEEITALPFIFKYNRDLCLAIEGFRFYFDLKNVLTIMILVYSYSQYIQNGTGITLNVKQIRLMQVFLNLFPCIAFLPFTDNVYTFPERPWCSLPSSNSIIWEIFIQYLWVWIMLIAMSIMNAKILVKLNLNFDSLLLHNYLTNVGNYSLVTFISWVPRTIIRFLYYNSNRRTGLYFYAYYPVYLAGIMYVILFFRNIKNVISFESQVNPSNDSGVFDESIWDGMIVSRDSRAGPSFPDKSFGATSSFFRFDSRASTDTKTLGRTSWTQRSSGIATTPNPLFGVNNNRNDSIDDKNIL